MDDFTSHEEVRNESWISSWKDIGGRLPEGEECLLFFILRLTNFSISSESSNQSLDCPRNFVPLRNLE
jgi:hypothetical protein